MIIKLKKGDTVSIFTDYQDCTGYEGKAVLIEKIKDGDSFYITNEKIKPDDEKFYSEEDKQSITKFNRINTFLKNNSVKNPRPYCKKLYKELTKLRKGEVTEHLKMSKGLNKYRKVHINSTKTIGNVLRENTNNYIIRFIQQDQKNWKPSIYSYERWKLRFIEDITGWETNWTTCRNIRVLKCFNPNERNRRSQLVEFTTYDGGMSSRQYDRIIDVHKYNKNKKKELNQASTIIDDDDMDKLIEKRLNKL